MVVKWQFHDPSLGQTYVFEVNPNESDIPGLRRSLVTQGTTGPGGNVIVFEGRTEAKKGSFKGVLLSESQLNTMETWAEKRNQITVTDDLGRTYSIIAEGFEAKRRWRQSHPWKHDYTLNFVLVDWQV